ncbi:MAG: hypothetical protein ABW223_04740 [Rariglobus sp.]
MSTSVSPRPLSLLPFVAADAVLLLTALLIAWRTPDELTGGPLLAVVVCTGLGAILAVLPFVLNDAREREAALAERQRELAELVTTSTASASRWGTQWAAAATGLEDAAALASRSIAAADRLPVVFQEKVDGLTQKFEQAEREAQSRAESAASQEAALAARAEQIGSTAAGLQQTLTEFGSVQAGLTEQRTAISSLLKEFPAAASQAQAARKELEDRLVSAPAQIEKSIAGIVSHAEARLSALLAEFPVAAAQAQSARKEFEERLLAAPAQLEERVNVLTAQSEARLGELSAALTNRLSDVETLIGSLRERLQTAIDTPLPQPAPVAALPVVAEEKKSPVSEAPIAQPAVTAAPADHESEKPEPEVIVAAAAEEAVEAVHANAKLTDLPEPAPVAEVAPAPAVEPAADVAPELDVVASPAPVAQVVALSEKAEKPTAATEKQPIRSDTIMDPFIIPDNGYDALAAAMDGDRA